MISSSRQTSVGESSESSTGDGYVYYIIVRDEGLLPRAKQELFEIVHSLHEVESEDELKYDMRYDDQTQAFILGVYVDAASERDRGS